MSDLTTYIRNKIRKERISQELSTQDLAELIAMNKRNYQRIENGECKILDIELVERIASALKLQILDFFPQGWGGGTTTCPLLIP